PTDVGDRRSHRRGSGVPIREHGDGEEEPAQPGETLTECPDAGWSARKWIAPSGFFDDRRVGILSLHARSMGMNRKRSHGKGASLQTKQVLDLVPDRQADEEAEA